MLLARFKAYLDDLSKDPTIGACLPNYKVYRHFEGKWFNESNAEVTDIQLIADLGKTKSHQGPHRPRKSRTVWFPVHEIDCVITSVFSAPPKVPTQQKISKKLLTALKHSNDAFDAKHDALTGLFNKGELLNGLCRALFPDVQISKESSEAASNEMVAVYTIDIDHFKQVNDTYGHIYGDVVIKCCAARLGKAIEHLNEKFASVENAWVARPGGEEFTIVVSGSLIHDDLNGIANIICKCIGDDVLPTESEWSTFRNSYPPELALPHTSERRITVSVGYASTPLSTEVTKVKSAAHAILQQADTALYRAKSGGRNTSRNYAEILAKYGTVLEHHIETNVVSIDIGSQVGVQQGQDFWVFHPDFCGTKPFLYSDGRTKKRLGMYPRHSNGRIEVFEVQLEISFCHIVEAPPNGMFPVGAHLESIPLGSIGHLLQPHGGMQRRGGRNINEVAELRNAINKLIGEDLRPRACVLSLEKFSTVQKQRGLAFLNQSLAAIYEVAEKEFPKGSVVGLIEATKVGAIFSQGSLDEMRGWLEKIISTCTQRLGEHTQVVAGAYFPDSSVGEDAGEATLNNYGALEFALYACSEGGRDSGKNVEIFSSETASRVLLTARRAKRYESLIADYERFVDLGVNSASLSTQVALAAYERAPPDLGLAVASAKLAVQQNPAVPTYWMNLGLIEYSASNFDSAFDAFRKLQEFDNFGVSKQYRAAMAHTFYLAFKNGRVETTKDEVLTLLELARNVPEQSRLSVPRLIIERCFYELTLHN